MSPMMTCVHRIMCRVDQYGNIDSYDAALNVMRKRNIQITPKESVQFKSFLRMLNMADLCFEVKEEEPCCICFRKDVIYKEVPCGHYICVECYKEPIRNVCPECNAPWPERANDPTVKQYTEEQYAHTLGGYYVTRADGTNYRSQEEYLADLDNIYREVEEADQRDNAPIESDIEEEMNESEAEEEEPVPEIAQFEALNTPPPPPTNRRPEIRRPMERARNTTRYDSEELTNMLMTEVATRVSLRGGVGDLNWITQIKNDIRKIQAASYRSRNDNMMIKYFAYLVAIIMPNECEAQRREILKLHAFRCHKRNARDCCGTCGMDMCNQRTYSIREIPNNNGSRLITVCGRCNQINNVNNTAFRLLYNYM